MKIRNTRKAALTLAEGLRLESGQERELSSSAWQAVAEIPAVAAFVACGWVLVTPDAAPVVVTPIEAEPEPKSRRRGK